MAQVLEGAGLETDLETRGGGSNHLAQLAKSEPAPAMAQVGFQRRPAAASFRPQGRLRKVVSDAARRPNQQGADMPLPMPSCFEAGKALPLVRFLAAARCPSRWWSGMTLRVRGLYKL